MSDDTQTFRVRGRRAGNAGVLAFNFPMPVSRLFPVGHHDFDLSLTEDGILLRYVGPSVSGHERVEVDRPSWLPGGGTER